MTALRSVIASLKDESGRQMHAAAVARYLAARQVYCQSAAVEDRQVVRRPAAERGRVEEEATADQHVPRGVEQL